MRPRDSGFLRPERIIKKGQTTSFLSSKSLHWVRSYRIIMVSPLTPSHCLERAEEADSHEQLEFDEAEYPQLPGNVCELCLHHRKVILRQFMAAVRCMYYSKGFL
jgi:hypothetical protein